MLFSHDGTHRTRIDVVPVSVAPLTFVRIGPEDIFICSNPEHDHNDILRFFGVSKEKQNLADAGKLWRKRASYPVVASGESTSLDFKEDKVERALTNDILANY